MKKTLIALAVTAFAASASAKIEVFNQDGTEVSIDGRIHVVAEKKTEKVKGQKTTGHSNLVNDGTRFGFNVKHNINDDFYALGRVEARFDGSASNESKWGNAYAKRAWAGLGHKQLGQLTFGRQLLIGDDIGRIGLDNHYGVGSSAPAIGGWDILNENADSAVRYSYTGIEGLELGADYIFADKHDTVGERKNGYDVGGIYQFAAGAGTASVSLAYSHNDFETGSSTKANQDGVYGGFNYVINGVKVGVDGGYSVKKAGENKDKLRYIRTGLRYDIAGSNAGVYGNYSHVVIDRTAEKALAALNNEEYEKAKMHRFMLGTDYKFHKNVKVYLEGRLDKIRFHDTTKRTDKAIGTGLVVYW